MNVPSDWLSTYCRILECSDLSVISGACNPYAIIGITSVRGAKTKVEVKAKKTTVKKKTTDPHFHETFSFDVRYNLNSYSVRIDFRRQVLTSKVNHVL